MSTEGNDMQMSKPDQPDDEKRTRSNMGERPIARPDAREPRKESKMRNRTRCVLLLRCRHCVFEGEGVEEVASDEAESVGVTSVP